jgi:putative alpha-1,2-mannosidase
VTATPGYFSLKMVSDIKAEMTVTNHTALYRFTFPSQPVEQNATLRPLILVDLNDLPLSRSNGAVKVDESTGQMSGSGTFK